MSNLPIYIQIHDTIKRDIETGRWSVGDRLPSERELAVRFEVSRMTVRQAIQILTDEGILERKVGSGTYVAHEKVQEKLTRIASFTEITLEQNRVPTSQTISYHITNPSSSELEKLQLIASDRIIRMERIRFADNIPICFEVASIPYSLVKKYSKSEITTSFYKTLEERANYKIGHVNQTISAMQASERIAEYLKIKRGDAILRLRQISYLENGVPFEYVRTQYVGNRFEFYFEN